MSKSGAALDRSCNPSQGFPNLKILQEMSIMKLLVRGRQHAPPPSSPHPTHTPITISSPPPLSGQINGVHLVAPKCDAGTKADAAANAHATKAFLAGTDRGGGAPAAATDSERPDPGATTNTAASPEAERADALGEPGHSGFSGIGGAAATLVVGWGVEPSGLNIDLQDQSETGMLGVSRVNGE